MLTVTVNCDNLGLMGIPRDGATTGAIIEIFRQTLETKPRNARYLAQILRDAGLLAGEGDHVGTRLTTTEAVTWFIGQVNASSLPKAPETIALFRSAKMSGHTFQPVNAKPNGFAAGLFLPAARTLGEALDGFVNDMRSGAFALWADRGTTPELTIEFHENGTALLILDRPLENVAFMVSYGTFQRTLSIDRIVRIDLLAVFSKLAAALGPLSANENDQPWQAGR